MEKSAVKIISLSQRQLDRFNHPGEWYKADFRRGPYTGRRKLKGQQGRKERVCMPRKTRFNVKPKAGVKTVQGEDV